MRTHVVLPEDLVAEVDKYAGKRGRSKFIEEAVRRKVLVARQRAAIARLKESPILDAHPEWATPEKTYEWVREGRRQDSARLDEKVARWRELLDRPPVDQAE